MEIVNDKLNLGNESIYKLKKDPNIKLTTEQIDLIENQPVVVKHLNKLKLQIDDHFKKQEVKRGNFVFADSYIYIQLVEDEVKNKKENFELLTNYNNEPLNSSYVVITTKDTNEVELNYLLGNTTTDILSGIYETKKGKQLLKNLTMFKVNLEEVDAPLKKEREVKRELSEKAELRLERAFRKVQRIKSGIKRDYKAFKRAERLYKLKPLDINKEILDKAREKVELNKSMYKDIYEKNKALIDSELAIFLDANKNMDLKIEEFLKDNKNLKFKEDRTWLKKIENLFKPIKDFKKSDYFDVIKIIRKIPIDYYKKVEDHLKKEKITFFEELKAKFVNEEVIEKEKLGKVEQEFQSSFFVNGVKYLRTKKRIKLKEEESTKVELIPLNELIDVGDYVIDSLSKELSLDNYSNWSKEINQSIIDEAGISATIKDIYKYKETLTKKEKKFVDSVIKSFTVDIGNSEASMESHFEEVNKSELIKKAKDLQEKMDGILKKVKKRENRLLYKKELEKEKKENEEKKKQLEEIDQWDVMYEKYYKNNENYIQLDCGDISRDHRLFRYWHLLPLIARNDPSLEIELLPDIDYIEEDKLLEEKYRQEEIQKKLELKLQIEERIKDFKFFIFNNIQEEILVKKLSIDYEFFKLFVLKKKKYIHSYVIEEVMNAYYYMGTSIQYGVFIFTNEMRTFINVFASIVLMSGLNVIFMSNNINNFIFFREYGFVISKIDGSLSFERKYYFFDIFKFKSMEWIDKCVRTKIQMPEIFFINKNSINGLFHTTIVNEEPPLCIVEWYNIFEDYFKDKKIDDDFGKMSKSFVELSSEGYWYFLFFDLIIYLRWNLNRFFVFPLDEKKLTSDEKALLYFFITFFTLRMDEYDMHKEDLREFIVKLINKYLENDQYLFIIEYFFEFKNELSKIY